MNVAEFEVRVRTLDEFSLAPCLIKIDVQGTEAAVVEGALETIRQHRPVLFVEDPDARLLKLLASFRYRRYGLRRGTIENNARPTKNVLLVPEDSEALRAISRNRTGQREINPARLAGD